jgi:hypothetical protein
VVVVEPVSVGITVTVVYVVEVTLVVVAGLGAPRSLCVSTTSPQTSLGDLLTSWVSGNGHYDSGATAERTGAGVSRIDRGAPSTPCSRAGGSGIGGCA